MYPRCPDEEMIEPVARAIAATKRGLMTDAQEIDGIWRSYIGQARAAIKAMQDATNRYYMRNTMS